MSADTDRLDARFSAVEGTVKQMDKPIGGLNDRLDYLDERMDNRFDALDGRINDVDNSPDDKIGRDSSDDSNNGTT